MPAETQPVYLLASHEPSLLRPAEAALRATGARVEIALSAEDVLARINAPAPLSPALDLLLLDTGLPGMTTGEILAAAHAESSGIRYPIALFSDIVLPEWSDRLADGIIDDVFSCNLRPDTLRHRVGSVLCAWRNKRELEQLRETMTLYAEIDPLTGTHNRAALMAALFRETDRAQRMNTPLSAILLDVDDFGHWNSRLGSGACDRILVELTQRITRLLRTYDLLGRTGNDEFLAALPGCSTVNATLLAERIRAEVFSAPIHIAGHAVRVSACFGIASSHGRSPVIVLREAEEALRLAKEEGPESIRCAGADNSAVARPVTFLSPTSEDDLLAW